jgi:hypothetical protein
LNVGHGVAILNETVQGEEESSVVLVFRPSEIEVVVCNVLGGNTGCSADKDFEIFAPLVDDPVCVKTTAAKVAIRKCSRDLSSGLERALNTCGDGTISALKIGVHDGVRVRVGNKVSVRSVKQANERQVSFEFGVV